MRKETDESMPISLKFLSRRFALSMQRMTFALILITWFMLLIAVPSAFVLSFALGLSFASIKEVSRCYYQQCLSISHKQHGVRRRLQSQNFIGKDGMWSFSSNGSSNTCASNSSMEHLRMLSISRFGLPFVHTFYWL